MFFRNLTFFRFPASLDFNELDTGLSEFILKPVGALEMNSRGFISPFGREEKEALSHRIAEHLWLTVGGEDKILPGAVVNDLAAGSLSELPVDMKETRGAVGLTTQATAEQSAAVSLMRFEKPHSLSYQDSTRTSPPSTTCVCVASKVEEAGLWLKSMLTSGSVL